MVSPDLKSMAEKISAPLSECSDDRQLFLFVYRVVQFGAFECARVVCNGARRLVRGAERENCPGAVVTGISGDEDLVIRHCAVINRGEAVRGRGELLDAVEGVL